jgi:hypothetical protein
MSLPVKCYVVVDRETARYIRLLVLLALRDLSDAVLLSTNAVFILADDYFGVHILYTVYLYCTYSTVQREETSMLQSSRTF